MSPKKTLLLLVLIISFLKIHSQTPALDSLKYLVKTTKDDTIKQCCKIYIGVEEKMDNTGYWDTILQECDQVLAQKQPTLVSFVIQQYKAFAYNTLGYIYETQGQSIRSLEYYQKSLKIDEGIHNHAEVIVELVNIGKVFLYQENYSLAREYFNKSIKLNLKEVGNKEILYKATNNIAVSYGDEGNQTEALKYHQKCLKIAQEIPFREGIAMSFYHIGIVYIDKSDFKTAIEYCEKALKMMQEDKDDYSAVYALHSLGKIYFKMGDLKKAYEYGIQSLELAKKTKNLESTMHAANLLYDIYKKKGNYEEALKMHELHVTLKDSVKNEQSRKQTLQKSFQFEFDKKEAEVKAIAKVEKEKIELKAAEDKKRQNMIIYSVIAGLMIVSIFSIFIFRGLQKNKKANKIITQQNKLVEEKNHLIEEKQKEIIDSINYAQRIQRSLLASKELLDDNLDEYFILFKPKDIVSGDFYWASKLKNGHFAIVTADSTGHGVPGAIMSMLNIACLNEAISNGFTSPHDILFETRLRVIEHLKNDGSATGGKDGMDCSLLCIDHKNKLLYAAAANNPVWIIRNSEIIEIKPDKMPVGKHDRDHEPFTLHTIDLQKGDTIFTLTDGFPDQFGGEKGKKFMSKNLKELLKVNINLSLSEQKKALETTFTNWVGNIEQIDDVTIIGIKI